MQARIIEEYVRLAVADKIPLQVAGSGSKRFLAPQLSGERLDVTEYRGVESYYPDELVVTVRAGTGLAELEKQLAEQGQMLPFEPPQFRDTGTIGGAVSAGLSGPGTPWRGSVRDSVLGIEMLNGLGERLQFGGQVLKNVAGFDISRLVTGAFGQLGVLLKISLKLIPIPEAEVTVAITFESIDQLRHILKQPLPITATLIEQDRLIMRLSGERSAVEWAVNALQAKVLSGEGPWKKVRDHDHPFFKQPGNLWRLSVPVTTEIDQNMSWLVERGGNVRWLVTDECPENTLNYAQQLNGTVVGYGEHVAGRVSAYSSAYRDILAKVRQAFDPHGIFHSPAGESVAEPS